MECRLRQIIAARIERELESRNWTRADLASSIGMSPGHLNNMMSGERRFYDERIEQIAKAFGIPVESFVAERITYPGMLQEIIQKYTENAEFRAVCDAGFILLTLAFNDKSKKNGKKNGK